MTCFRVLAIPLRFLSVVLAVLLLASCSEPAEQTGKLKVATTFTVIADLAANVAGDAAEVVSITKPGAEIHNYQPTPQDLLRVKDADLVLWNGMGLEVWFEKFIRRIDNARQVLVSAGVEEIPIIKGPYRNKPNPHAWMSPTAALTYVENIRDALIEADSANEEIYRGNAARYSKEITDLVAPLREKLDTIEPGRRWLATSEGAFSYLARDFNLQEVYLWPMNADSQGTPQQVREMIDTINEHNVAAVFSESTVSDKPAKQVARETGARYGGVLYVDSLSDDGGPVPTYIDLLRLTTETIVRGLTDG